MKPDQLDDAAATKRVQSLHLQEVFILELHARHISAAPPGQLTFRTKAVEGEWAIQGNDVLVLLPFTLSIETTDQEEAPRELAEIRIEIRVQYRADEVDLSTDDLRHSVGVCAFLHAWPYFRAEVQLLTTKLGFPALTLPVVLSGEVPRRFTLGAPKLLDSNGLPQVSRATKPLAKKLAKRQKKKRSSS